MYIKCGKYTLRDWKKDTDWPPEGFTYGSFTLEYKNKQVAAVAGSINSIIKIQTRPTCSGHGTKFIEMMMKEARRREETTFKVQGVIGDTPKDKEVMEHILRNFGFRQIDEETWVASL